METQRGDSAAGARLEAVPEPQPAAPNEGAPEVERVDNGFELDGRFYPLRMRTGHPKDLLLLDRITAGRGFELASEAADDDRRESIEERWGITWTICLIATSIRAAHPAWSVERVYDRVMSIEDLDAEVAWIGGEAEAQPLPPDEAAGPSSSSSQSES